MRSRKACPERSRGGFTLIELLVVIGVIVFFAAILFPVFAKAKAKAQISSCQSNLKQLALAGQMYASDNNGELPPPTGKSDYFTATKDYCRNDFECPSYTWTPKTSGGYGANYNLKSIHRIIGDPTKIPMLAETRHGKLWFQTPQAVSRRHGMRANVVFADGHVKSFRRLDDEDDFGKMTKGFEGLDFMPKLKPTVASPPVTTTPRAQERYIRQTDPDGTVWVGTLHRE